MASISNDPGGKRRILFSAPDGRRRAIRLGKVSERAAQTVRIHVEHLAAALTTRTAPPMETTQWVSGLDDIMHAKLARVGLVEPKAKRARVKLGAFLDDYLASRTDAKASTHLVLGHTKRNLISYFGADALLDSITPAEAGKWRAELAEKLSANTVRRRCGIAKQYFRAAMKRGLVTMNPFGELKSSVIANPARFHFVDRQTIEKVVAACPDGQWRLMVALARYGGLRTPSETLALRWCDIDWARSRMKVTAPKTEHLPGDGIRWVPLFPEMLPPLREAFEAAVEGDYWVITRYRDTACNLRTQFKRIIERAGVTSWPKLWQNLRSTRETELVAEFPVHVVCRWLGNSPSVATKHYLQVTEEHYRQAAQNAAQQPQELAGSEEKNQPRYRERGPKIALAGSATGVTVGDEGLEPPTPSV